MLAKDVKNGSVVNYNGAPVIIRGITVQSPSARGAATLYKFKGRNLVTKQKQDITAKGNEVLKEADFMRRPVKLMYADVTHMHMLDQEDFGQYSLPLEDIQNEAQYINEELEFQALIYNDECVSVEVPTTVELLVTQCDPAAQGNSATKRTKPATLETGLIVQVPEHLGDGERIKVDSRTGDYIGRA
ncbi:UNVERIFIED_CONTAM: hypothetical protein GTU68_052655 [Idotea baltica]|nr:hypothetical protein [Idotea baltica]